MDEENPQNRIKTWLKQEFNVIANDSQLDQLTKHKSLFKAFVYSSLIIKNQKNHQKFIQNEAVNKMQKMINLNDREFQELIQKEKHSSSPLKNDLDSFEKLRKLFSLIVNSEKFACFEKYDQEKLKNCETLMEELLPIISNIQKQIDDPDSLWNQQLVQSDFGQNIQSIHKNLTSNLDECSKKVLQILQIKKDTPENSVAESNYPDRMQCFNISLDEINDLLNHYENFCEKALPKEYLA